MRGSCLCGKIEFRIDGAYPKMYQCHCSLCRKQGGSSSNTSLVIEASNFHWTFGKELISSYVKPTGFRSDFCSHCGSPVPNPLRKTAYYWVPAGLLDDAAHLEIGAHLCVDSKATWDKSCSEGVEYDSCPDLHELIQLLYIKT